MYSLKGFVEFAGLASNTPGVVAKIGELSSLAMTYSKEKGFYDSVTYKDVEITSFSSKQDANKVEIPASVKTKVFDVVAWLYGQMIATSNTQDRTTLLSMLANTFGTTAEQIECGTIVTDGTLYVPEWLAWKVVGSESYIRLWFTDESFRTQYDEYEIVVVPALVKLDNFFLPASDVETYLKAMTTNLMVDRMQIAKAGYPETIMRVETYDYIAPGNPDFKVPSRWGVLIYGEAGNNVDAIKDAIVNYVLANSTHPRTEWVNILPDLFKRTEFIFTPLYTQYGIPNRTLEAGVYSPLIKLPDAKAAAKKTASKYPQAHIDNYISFMGHPYKSLALVILGGPENRQGKFYFTDFYPDFISVNTSSIDFNRMSQETQDIANMLADMIYEAESVTKFSVLPFGMTKLIRDNILFVVRTVNNVQFLVAAKSNFVS